MLKISCGMRKQELEKFLATSKYDIFEADLNENCVELLTDIFANNFAQLLILHLNKCKIVDIEIRAFSKLKFLENLSLNGNVIESIRQNIFIENHNLSCLNLKENRLKMVYNNLFESTLKLTKLHLSNNEIAKFSYKELNNLEILDLSRNKIGEFKNNTFPKLTRLNLKRNKLKKINKNMFENIRNLRHLNLSRNQISLVEDKAFEEMSLLKRLKYEWNPIEEISSKLMPPDDYDLSILSLKGVQLKRIGKDNFSIGRIKKLNVSKQKSVRIEDDAFGNIGCLKSLYLRDVFFQNGTLPELSYLIYLQDLILSTANNIPFPENHFTQLKNLKFLHLMTRSESTVLRAPIMHTHNSLMILTLIHCRITYIHLKVFENLNQLEYLNLSFNKMAILDAFVFRGLLKIKQILINNNILINFTFNPFENNIFLEAIHLEKNKILEMNSTFFQHIKSLKTLYLDENCVCSPLKYGRIVCK